MEMPAEFGGQLSSQQPTQSIVYLPNGQCATIPIVGNASQQQNSLHHQLLMNGGLLHGNNNANMQGNNPLLSQFNSFNPQTMQQQQQSNDVAASHVTTSSTLPISTSTIPAIQLQQTTPFQQQQHPLVAMASVASATNTGQQTSNQTMLPSNVQNAAALFQQQQQENVCFIFLMFF
jgi:hypothetical protein